MYIKLSFWHHFFSISVHDSNYLYAYLFLITTRKFSVSFNTSSWVWPWLQQISHLVHLSGSLCIFHGCLTNTDDFYLIPENTSILSVFKTFLKYSSSWIFSLRSHSCHIPLKSSRHQEAYNHHIFCVAYNNIHWCITIKLTPFTLFELWLRNKWRENLNSFFWVLTCCRHSSIWFETQ